MSGFAIQTNVPALFAQRNVSLVNESLRKSQERLSSGTRINRAADDAEAAGRVLLALAKDIPQRYGDLIRIQKQYAARQEAKLEHFLHGLEEDT